MYDIKHYDACISFNLDTEGNKMTQKKLPHFIHIESPLMLISKIFNNRNISMKSNSKCPLYNTLLGNNSTNVSFLCKQCHFCKIIIEACFRIGQIGT